MGCECTLGRRQRHVYDVKQGRPPSHFFSFNVVAVWPPGGGWGHCYYYYSKKKKKRKKKLKKILN